MIFLNVMFSLDLYPKVLTLLLMLPPVFVGERMRPERIFPIFPLVFYFVECVIHKMILYNMVMMAGGYVAVKRLQVFKKIVSNWVAVQLNDYFSCLSPYRFLKFIQTVC